jgi:hypothetical protein
MWSMAYGGTAQPDARASDTSLGRAGQRTIAFSVLISAHNSLKSAADLVVSRNAKG